MARPGLEPGDTTGFVLEWDGQAYGALYISGHAVWCDELEAIAKWFKIDTAAINLGRQRVRGLRPPALHARPASGARLADLLDANRVIPMR